MMNKLFINIKEKATLTINIKEKVALTINMKERILLYAHNLVQKLKLSSKFNFIGSLDIAKNAILLFKARTTNSAKVDSQNESHKLYRNVMKSNCVSQESNDERILLRNEIINSQTEEAMTFSQKLYRNKANSASDTKTRSAPSETLRNTVNLNIHAEENIFDRKLLRSSSGEQHNLKVLSESAFILIGRTKNECFSNFIPFTISRVSKFDNTDIKSLDTMSTKNMSSAYPSLYMRQIGKIHMTTQDCANAELIKNI